MQTSFIVLYRIDKDDRLVFMNSAWDRFALENDAPDMVAEKLLHRSLWDFIVDNTTGALYKEILQIARARKILQINFNCDSPDRMRSMEMTVSAEKDGGVQFQTRTLEIKGRAPQKILDRKTPRTKGFIYMCSWCKAIDVGTENWKDLDEAISILGLFKQSELPGITHGICDNCYHSLSEKISERKNF